MVVDRDYVFAILYKRPPSRTFFDVLLHKASEAAEHQLDHGAADPDLAGFPESFVSVTQPA